jgi:uncharacterized protein DUF5678
MPRAARIPRDDDHASYVDRIREHVEREEVGAARRILAEALREGSHEPGLTDWERLLAPGKVLGTSPPSESDFETDFRCLEGLARDYKGQWVAVFKGELLANARSYAELRAHLSQKAPQARPLVYFFE